VSEVIAKEWAKRPQGVKAVRKVVEVLKGDKSRDVREYVQGIEIEEGEEEQREEVKEEGSDNIDSLLETRDTHVVREESKVNEEGEDSR
jgi:hypothetical protein